MKFWNRFKFSLSLCIGIIAIMFVSSAVINMINTYQYIMVEHNEITKMNEMLHEESLKPFDQQNMTLWNIRTDPLLARLNFNYCSDVLGFQYAKGAYMCTINIPTPTSKLLNAMLPMTLAFGLLGVSILCIRHTIYYI